MQLSWWRHSDFSKWQSYESAVDFIVTIPGDLSQDSDHGDFTVESPNEDIWE